MEWNPSKLKKRKAPELLSTNKQIKTKSRDKNDNKYQDLAENRIDLVDLQKKLVLKELEIKEKELEYWNIKVKTEKLKQKIIND